MGWKNILPKKCEWLNVGLMALSGMLAGRNIMKLHHQCPDIAKDEVVSPGL
jgi:hypothetical protein